MKKARRQKRSATQTLLWLLSLFLAGSMVISLLVVAFPGAGEATPTPEPTQTLVPSPTATSVPTPQPAGPGLPPPLVGPEQPTATPAL